MEELLKKLLEANILTEDTKADLEAAFQSQLCEAVEETKERTSQEVRAELTEQWITERDALIDAVDHKVTDYMTREIDELKEDVERFRDLEAEFAERVVEEREKMATELQKDMEELVEKLDTFLEMRLTAEVSELREDLDEAKRLRFGAELFEGFVNEYRKNFVNEKGVERELVETRKRLDDAQEQLAESQRKIDKSVRQGKMAKLLESLDGKQREVMQSILARVPTSQLDEAYKTFIGRVLREAVEVSEPQKEKEEAVLAEGDSKKQQAALKGKVITGDTLNVVTEGLDEVTVSADQYEKLRRMAGISV